MCGRFAQQRPASELAEIFGAEPLTDELGARFNVAPTDPLYETFQRPKDGRDCGCKEDLNNFAPRIGLAYKLNDKTVIRSGYGLFYGEADYITSESARWINRTRSTAPAGNCR